MIADLHAIFLGPDPWFDLVGHLFWSIGRQTDKWWVIR